MKTLSFVLVLLFAIPAQADDVQMVEDYIRLFHKNVKRQRADRAVRHAPVVVRMANKYNIHPLRLAVLISFESSWNPRAVGSIGEKGLTQCHGVAGMGLDLSTPRGQIECGARHLRRGLNKCGNWLGALTFYQTKGRCSPILQSARIRNREYNLMMKMFDNGGD